MKAALLSSRARTCSIGKDSHFCHATYKGSVVSPGNPKICLTSCSYNICKSNFAAIILLISEFKIISLLKNFCGLFYISEWVETTLQDSNALIATSKGFNIAFKEISIITIYQNTNEI